MKLDAFQFEILSRKLVATLDEMYFAIQQAARSSYVKEAADFGIAFLTPGCEVFAYPSTATFNFLLDSNFRTTVEAVGKLEPGDVILTNDPYLSGGLSTHLPDLSVIMPYFDDGRIIAYCWAFVHCADIGGGVPGSMSPGFSDIHQEGLRIPPVKVVEGGIESRSVMAILSANTRMTDQVIGDLRSMLGALKRGEEHFANLVTRYGRQQICDVQDDLLEYVETAARGILRKIPDGVYEFWDYVDDDVLTGIPLRVRVKLTVTDGAIDIDVSGSDPQVAAAYNVPSNGMRMFWLTHRLSSFLTTYGEDLPHNAGMLRSLTASIPEHSIFNAQYPDAVSMRSLAPRRLFDAITGALLQAAPNLLPAPAGGAFLMVAFAEPSPDGIGQIVEVIEPLRSGGGALHGQDGTDARENNMNNMRNHPLELIEAISSIRTLSYDIVTDSGGAGRWRGGVGQRLSFEVVSESGTLLVRGIDRMRFAPWGVGGGKAARGMMVFVERTDGTREHTKSDNVPVVRGDRLIIEMPGGGGVGDPLQREPEKVFADVIDGFVSEKCAWTLYGVVVRDGALDEKATQRLRSEMSPALEQFDFGPERAAWEAVFSDELMSSILAFLQPLPKQQRALARRQIFETIVPGISERSGRSLSELIGDIDDARRRAARWLAENEHPQTSQSATHGAR